MFQLDEDNLKCRACIKVVGIGGGGGNAIKTMYQSGLNGVEFIVANTDMQALEEHEDLDDRIQLGAELTKGLGAGANPEIGRQAAIESCDEILTSLQGADMVFITAGMGGGTGTGAAGVIARIAKQQGALVVGVATRPFFFEGQRRSRHAETGIQFLKENVDTLIIIPNQKLISITDEDTSLVSAFKQVDKVLLQAVKGIVDLVNKKGLINLDFADVKTVMSEKGLALIGVGEAQGENRAMEAGRQAVASPLLEDNSFQGASGLIINITGGADLSLQEVNQVAEFITNEAHPDAEIIFGAVIDPTESENKIKVTVIATGFEENTQSLGKQRGRILDNAKRFSSVERASANQSTEKNVENTEATRSIKTTVPEQLKEKETTTSNQQNSETKGKLPRDILLEKAKAYKEQQEQTSVARKTLDEPEQLSMIQENSNNRSQRSGLHRHNELPFKKESKKISFTGLFKKPDKTI